MSTTLQHDAGVRGSAGRRHALRQDAGDGRPVVRSVHTASTQKHEHVTVWCMRGNHDVDSSLALQIALKFYFHHEPRVTVDDGTSYFKYLRSAASCWALITGHGARHRIFRC